MNDSSNLPRRQFLRTFTLLTATSVLSGRTWKNTLVAQLLPTGGMLKLRLSQFPALQNDFGSVRIGTSAVVRTPTPDAPNCMRPLNSIPSLYPVIINRAPGNQFHALSAECPHAACTVAKLNPQTASGILVCSGHGSRFQIDGSLTTPRVGPAASPLIQYAVAFDGTDTLRVTLPDVFFEFSTQGVAPANPNRIALNFLASTNLTYEVWYRDTLEGTATNVPFSTTPAGTNRTSISGIDDFVTVYVERQGPAGFYQVAMRVSEV